MKHRLLTGISLCAGLLFYAACGAPPSTLPATVELAATATPVPTATIEAASATATLPSATATTASETGQVKVEPAAPDCVSMERHPQGAEIAENMNVPYEEVMGWVCAEFGFGDVKRAYRASAQSGLPVAELLTLLRENKGNWAFIEEQLGIASTSDD